MNYIKIPFEFIMVYTNDYVIQPISKNIVEPINKNIIQPILISKPILISNTRKGETLIQKKSKFVRFNDTNSYVNNYINSDKNSDINDVNDVNDVNELSDEELESIKCYHLKQNKQTYFEHLGESLSYSGRAFKASFYFFIHALIPDLFQYNGSATVYSLTNTIKYKYESNLEEI